MGSINLNQSAPSFGDSQLEYDRINTNQVSEREARNAEVKSKQPKSVMNKQQRIAMRLSFHKRRLEEIFQSTGLMSILEKETEASGFIQYFGRQKEVWEMFA